MVKDEKIYIRFENKYWRCDSMRKVMILDTTLREGEQTPGVSFTVEEKLQIARALDEAGVDMIEAGHPAVSRDVAEAVKKIASERLSAEILAHSRAIIADVDAALNCDVQRVAIFLGVTEAKLRSMKMTKEDAVSTAISCIEYAKSHGLKVRFTAEDATRAEYEYVVSICRAAVEAGADRISIPDTVGSMTPSKTKDLFTKLSKDLKAELDAHCHNDLGMAVANALAAVEGGATAVHTTVNGLGERAGITALEPFAVALKVLYDVDTVELDKLPELSAMVEKFSGIPVAPTQPIVGENAFSHKGGVHAAAVIFDPRTYEAFPPGLVGRQREIVISKYAGRVAVEDRLKRLGVALNEEELLKVLSAIKERPEIRSYRDVDLLELAEKATGRRLEVQVPKKIEAIVMVKCESNVYTTSVARRILWIKGVERVLEVSGDFDIEVLINVDSITQMNEVLENIRLIKGVTGTNTRVVLKKFNSLSRQE
ncbi:MAG: homocitrate synthase [Candidatus Methanomethylicaceae archaeon]|nr:homocitrate synthase [Candidatus Verstraetearchaeota archaeon]